MSYTLSLFTKPWKEQTPDQLGELAAGLGFDAIEFPLRPGYQVDPENALKGLPALSRTLERYGVRIASVASSTQEHIFAACQEAGVPVIRIMLLDYGDCAGYMQAESAWVRMLDGLCPLCEKYGVRIAVQQHQGQGVFSSMDLRHLLERTDARYIGGIWDAAHSALAGETPEKALDILWDYLAMVNFKNAFYRRTNGPEAKKARFGMHFTTAAHGAADWERAVRYLKSRSYEGVVCMPAEYTDTENVDRYIARDVRTLKALLEDPE
jgi:sugar phosphate isomerase/epimerase